MFRFRKGGKRKKRSTSVRPSAPAVQSRDHTVAFMELRAVARRSEQGELKRVSQYIRMLEYSMGCEEPEVPAARGSLMGVTNGWFSRSESAPKVDESELDSTAECPVCQYVVRSTTLFGRVHGRRFCELCSSVVCSQCSDDSDRIEIRFGAGEAAKRKGMSTRHDYKVLCTCKRCHTFYRKWKARNDRNELVHEERDHPIVKFYSLVVDIRNCILKSMPKLAEVMNRMTSNPVKATPDDYEMALRLDQSLAAFFENLKLAINKLKSIEANGPRDESLKRNILRALVTLQKENFPHFRILQGERKAIKKPVGDPKEDLSIFSDGEDDEEVEERPPATPISSAPKITMVEPLIVPLRGGEIVLTGSNFNAHSSVKIGRTFCKCHCMNPELVVVSVPPMEHGDYSVSIFNPDGQADTLGGARLLLTDEFEDPPEESTSNVSATPPRRDKPSFESLSRGFASASWRDARGNDTGDTYDGWGSISESEVRKRQLYDDRQPSITSVTPAFSPLGGSRLIITGQYISQNVTVSVGDRTATVEKVEFGSGGGEDGECFVTVLSPALNTPGFKDVELRNPLGGKAMLNEVVFYADVDVEQRAPPREVNADAWTR